MTKGMSIRRQFQQRRSRRSGQNEVSHANSSLRTATVPRIARRMTLAIRMDELSREGVADQSELARLVHVSRARLTQIMNLLHLAPDIQEELLFLTVKLRGRDAVT